jgi:predicted nucleic acid-binding protein
VGIDQGHVEDAKRIVLGGYGLSARDAIHVAVMRSLDIDRILSFDAGFDRYPGIERIG